jgi:hypothetical protein
MFPLGLPSLLSLHGTTEVVVDLYLSLAHSPLFDGVGQVHGVMLPVLHCGAASSNLTMYLLHNLPIIGRISGETKTHVGRG